MKIDETEAELVIPTSDSTLGVTLESMESMKKAVLYARVSSDGQQKEGTIESQIVELKKQITAAGHELVKEYIDDGITGTTLDRPALEQLRQDAKANLFDRIYFHAADRIAREIEYQRIIIGELVKCGKQITIGGKEYEQIRAGNRRSIRLELRTGRPSLQEWSLRVVALFSLAPGPRKVPNTPSSVGLLTPNQCFSLMK